MKKLSVTTAVLCGICAILWTVKVVLEITLSVFSVNPFVFILDIACAIIWTCVFVVQILNCIKANQK